MKGILVVAVTSLALLGCGKADKLERICEDIVRSAVVDPDEMKINSIDQRMYDFGEGDLTKFFAQKYPNGMNDNAKKLLELRKLRLGGSKSIYVEVDYTAGNGSRKIRDRALCQYIRWGVEETELVSFAVQGIGYSTKDTYSFFSRYGRPKGLSITDKVK